MLKISSQGWYLGFMAVIDLTNFSETMAFILHLSAHEILHETAAGGFFCLTDGLQATHVATHCTRHALCNSAVMVVLVLAHCAAHELRTFMKVVSGS